MKAQKKRVYEITSETSLAKLSGVEIAINYLDDLSKTVSSTIPEKRGIVFACQIIAKRIFDDCNWVNGNVDENKFTPKEAKIRIEQIKRIVDIVNEIGKVNTTDVISLRGEVAGHKKSADLLAKEYAEMATKYERYERVEREDALEELVQNRDGEKNIIEEIKRQIPKVKKINRKLNQNVLYKRFNKIQKKTTKKISSDKK